MGDMDMFLLITKLNCLKRLEIQFLQVFSDFKIGNPNKLIVKLHLFSDVFPRKRSPSPVLVISRTLF